MLHGLLRFFVMIVRLAAGPLRDPRLPQQRDVLIAQPKIKSTLVPMAPEAARTPYQLPAGLRTAAITPYGVFELRTTPSGYYTRWFIFVDSLRFRFTEEMCGAFHEASGRRFVLAPKSALVHLGNFARPEEFVICLTDYERNFGTDAPRIEEVMRILAQLNGPLALTR